MTLLAQFLKLNNHSWSLYLYLHHQMRIKELILQLQSRGCLVIYHPGTFTANTPKSKIHVLLKALITRKQVSLSCPCLQFQTLQTTIPFILSP